MLRRGVLLGTAAATVAIAATSPEDKMIIDLQGATIQNLLKSIQILDRRITALEKGRQSA
jgi:hypothetical protein